MLMRVLLVESDPILAGVLREFLINEKIDVEVAYDGLIAKRLYHQRQFDVVITEANVHGMSGLELCNYIRDSWSRTQILILGEAGILGEEISKGILTDTDFLAKPFEFQELLQRTRALARKSTQMLPISRVLRVSDLSLDIDSKEVKRAGKPIELTKKEQDLLEYLMLNKGKTLSRTDILVKVWNLGFDTNTNIVDVYVNYLRKKIDIGPVQKLLVTVVGRGYMLREV